MKLDCWKIYTALHIIALIGCGGGGGGASTDAVATSTPTLSTGVFLDSAVTNIAYATATQSGYTDTSGRFKYVNGENVVFSVGSVKLPAVKAGATITPKDIAASDTNVLANILVFLQSLDDDGNASNGISIKSIAHDNAKTALDFSIPTSTFQINADFKKLVANSGSTTTTPVSVTAAVQHFTETLSSMGVVLPSAVISDVATAVVGKTVSLSGSQSTGPTGTTLSYLWTLTAPTGSNAKLSDAKVAAPTFAVDMAGDYSVTLVVSSSAGVKSVEKIVRANSSPDFGDENLYIFGKNALNDQGQTPLGCLTCSAEQKDSVCNNSGDYGSLTSTTSIWNTNSGFGNSALAGYSPWSVTRRVKNNAGQDIPYANPIPLMYNTTNHSQGFFSADPWVRHQQLNDSLFNENFIPNPEDGSQRPIAAIFLDIIFGNSEIGDPVDSSTIVRKRLCDALAK